MPEFKTKETMKTLLSAGSRAKTILVAAILMLPVFLLAEGSWPKEIRTAKSTVIMYQPQPDSMKRDHLFTRAAISITTQENPTPVFGAIWTDSKFSTDRESGICTIFDVNILNVRFPGIDTISLAKIQNFTKILEEEASSWNMEFSLDELKATLALNQTAVRKSAEFKNDPPEIIFARQNSVLVSYDGDPVFKDVENAGLQRAVNTPFLVLRDMQDRTYYLNGGNYWYKSQDPVKAAWMNIQAPSPNVSRYFEELKKQQDNADANDPMAGTDQPGSKKKGIPQIIVRTRPAELVQSQGDPKYSPIQGTQLLYVTNTDDNIFMTIDDNNYYILISGRWYRSSSLTGSWSFIDSENLPADFSRIPEGSDKDIVLASIAGTDASRDAVMDAQIPQTAAVDRQTAKCVVYYDGDPKFERIRGTDLARGLNTASTVLLYRNVYYVCDNAVWFVGPGPAGPWEVATSIPDDIQRIPPDDPAYNVKYVYIYDVQPDVVYIGYTPGYTGCYVYGPTVVYGTGWVYQPYYGTYYYPHPRTYGFCMHYNPWFGWSMGYTMTSGWFHYGHTGRWGYHGGWWGPPMYRPPYHPPYNHYYGSRPPAYREGHNTVNISNNRTNIYNRRTDGSARPVRQTSDNRQAPGDRNGNDRTRPGNNTNSREAKPPVRTGGEKNNVFTDRKGDVYRNDNGNWQKHNGRDWESAQPKTDDRTAKPPVRDDRTAQPPVRDDRTAKPPVQQERTPLPPVREDRTPKPPVQQERIAQPPVQQNRPPQPPAQQNRISQPPAQQNSGFNRQEMDMQNQARQRGTQNNNNRSNVQRAAPAAPAAPAAKARTGDGGRKR